MTTEMSTPKADADHIVLTLPGGEDLRDVATLVLGGVGSRVELPYEKLDDLQLAVLSVLAASGEGATTVDIEIGHERIAVSIGPVSEGSASADGLRQVLLRLVDSVEAHTHTDGALGVASG